MTTTTTTETNTASYNEVAADDATITVTSFNEIADENEETITDEQVPLAVRLDEGDETRTPATNVVSIEDEDTPLAATKTIGGRAWWYWILILISLIAGKVAVDKRKTAQATEDESDE